MQWKTVCFQCLQEVCNYQYPAKYILFKEDSVQSEASPTRFDVMVFFSEVMSLILNFFFVFLICSIRYVQHCRDMANVLCCLSTSQSWSTLNIHCSFIKFAFASCLFYHVYILDVVDIAMSAKIESKSFLHCSWCTPFTLSTLLIQQS